MTKEQFTFFIENIRESVCLYDIDMPNFWVVADPEQDKETIVSLFEKSHILRQIRRLCGLFPWDNTWLEFAKYCQNKQPFYMNLRVPTHSNVGIFRWFVLGIPLQNGYAFVIWHKAVFEGDRHVLPGTTTLNSLYRRLGEPILTRSSKILKNNETMRVFKKITGVAPHFYFHANFNRDSELVSLYSRFVVQSLYYPTLQITVSDITNPEYNVKEYSLSEFVFFLFSTCSEITSQHKKALELFDLNNNVLDFGRWLVFADYLADELNDPEHADILHNRLRQIQPYVCD